VAVEVLVLLNLMVCGCDDKNAPLALFKGPLGPEGRSEKVLTQRLLPSGNTLGWNFISFPSARVCTSRKKARHLVQFQMMKSRGRGK
jgi:hypothetical protein